VSERLGGGGGLSVWIYNGATTVDIGLKGPEHTHRDGYKYSNFDSFSETGQVVGYSNRYNGGAADLGQSVWFYDGATTIDIGLTGPEHTRNDGYKHSARDFSANPGQHVSGTSSRFNDGSAALGASAWLYDGATTINIGLAGPEHTRSDGFRLSSTSQLNTAGQVIGESNRYNGGAAGLGRSAWLYNGATTIHIGLTGPEHTHSSGSKQSDALELNEAGHVLGRSVRWLGFGGIADLGRSAWTFDGVTTVEIGLTGDEHMRVNGYEWSWSTDMNESGNVIGYALRYNGGSTELGQSAWLYDGTTTINVGFTGPEHTRDDGYKYSEAIAQNDAGQVMGFSSRYNGGSTEIGRSAWLYDGATTIDIGLTGPEHTNNDGYKWSVVSDMNEEAQVSGYSERFGGGGYLGRDAWLYDTSLNQTFQMQLFVDSSGFAFSEVEYLGEDGLVLGTYYTRFGGINELFDPRTFYFTVADGLHDLGSLVDGGLAANGWDYLASVIRINGLGQILGRGKLASQDFGEMPYLLTPVPEPGGLLLVTLGAMGLLVYRRR
jgi:hypothetical protein